MTQPATKAPSPARRASAPSLMKLPVGEGGYPKVVRPPNGTKVPSIDSLGRCGRLIDDSCLNITTSPFQKPANPSNSAGAGSGGLQLLPTTSGGEDFTSPQTPSNTSFTGTPKVVSEDVKAALRVRVQRFYKVYNPEKIGYVDYVMQRYKYDEERLISDLNKKYGPEPTSPTPSSSSEQPNAPKHNSSNSSNINTATPTGKTTSSAATTQILANYTPDQQKEVNMPSFTSPDGGSSTDYRRNSTSLISGTAGGGTSENCTPNGSFFNNSSFTRSFKVPQSSSTRSPIHDLPPPPTATTHQQKEEVVVADQLQKSYPILSKLTSTATSPGSHPQQQQRNETLNRIETSVLKRTGHSTPGSSNNNSFRLPPPQQPLSDTDSPHASNNHTTTTFIRVSNTGVGVSYPKAVLEDL